MSTKRTTKEVSVFNLTWRLYVHHSMHVLCPILRHWFQLAGALLIIGVSVGGCVYTGLYSSLNSTTKIAIISSVSIVDVVFFK